MPNPNSKYPSVTQALGPFAGLDRVRPDKLAAACERGTDAHTPSLAYSAGKFAFVKPEVQGYYDSFRRWFDRHVHTVVAVEPLWESHMFQYCGSPDLVIILWDEPHTSIWDLKTSKSVGRTWAGQLAAYRQLAIENGIGPIGRVASLRLKEDGSMPLAEDYQYSDRDFSAFLAALTAFKYFKG